MASDPAAIARLIVRYGAHDGALVSASLIFARPPAVTFRAGPDADGAWLIVRDAHGAPVQTIPLPDPRHGPESIGEDGALHRADGGAKERVHAVEAIYPGPGATFEIHVGGPGRSLRGTRGGGTLVAHGAFDPAPLQRAFVPQLNVHPGPGAANPHAKTILFLPDGFVAADMPLFHEAIATVENRILATQPYQARPQTLRFAHVDIASDDSGIGKKKRHTAFRGHFTIDRVIEVDQDRAASALDRYCGGTSAVALICANTTVYGGSGGAATVFSREPVWMSEIAIHELGHGWFGLADEYSAAGQAATMKPVEANVSGTCDRANLKWASWVGAATPLPTLADQPPGVIGAFEGAKYQASGVYRPAFDCKMRTPGVPFCAVCAAVINAELDRHEM